VESSERLSLAGQSLLAGCSPLLQVLEIKACYALQQPQEFIKIVALGLGEAIPRRLQHQINSPQQQQQQQVVVGMCACIYIGG